MPVNIKPWHITILLFVILIPVALSINFMQNDEWVHYLTVSNFLSKNFTLYPIIGSTFYTQGLMATIFSRIFTVKSLPVLTLIVSVGNFYIFSRIISLYTAKRSVIILLSLLFFLNPLHIYSTFGFMTENYLVFFCLLSLYFFLKFNHKERKKDFHLALLFTVLAFFVKQNAILLALSFGIYLMVIKKWKYALSCVFTILILLVFYQFVFPQTQTMQEIKGIHLDNFSHATSTYSIIFTSLIYLMAFVGPLALILILRSVKSLKQGVVLITISVVITVLLTHLLNLSFTARGEFPYFQNIAERSGFYANSINGLKYSFAGNFVFYQILDIFSKLSVGFLVTYLIFNPKGLINPLLIFILINALSLNLNQSYRTIYDRYLLLSFPMLICFFAYSIKLPLKQFEKILIGGFVLFLLFLNYQFVADFILNNRYVWARSKELTESGVAPNKINPSHAWRMLYPNPKDPKTDAHDYTYIFSYNKDDEDLQNMGYKTSETKKISYPLSFFIDPYIYLYER
ncbi:MAG: glycosyltransferase family 39 protein [Patescibacteria group bacterium]